MDNATPEIAAITDAAGESAPEPRPCLDALSELLARADQAGKSEDFVDALVRTLAWIVFRYDRSEITGDILHRLGGHLRELAERHRAQQELDALRGEGRPLQ
jgi:hypothetical protein